MTGEEERDWLETGWRGGVGLIRWQAEPGDGLSANALTAPRVAALADAVRRISESERFRALVLCSGGPVFAASALPGRPDPALATAIADLCDLVAGIEAPVIAALQGPASGAGMALALAARYRLARPEAALALPEIAYGLLPAPGALRRLTLIAGAATALDFCLRPGGRMKADDMFEAGLIDGWVEGDSASAAVAMAKGLTGGQADQMPRPAQAARADVFAAAAAARDAAATAQFPLASARIVDCIEAALLLPAAAARDFEATAAADAAADPAGRALRHALWAERHLSPGLLRRDDQGRLTLSPAGAETAGALLAAYRMAGAALRDAGAPAESVDAAARALGFAAGPLGGAGDGNGAAALALRVEAALLAEIARQIAAGRLAHWAEGDAMAVIAAGYPRGRGGPAYAAQGRGPALLAAMTAWGEGDPIWIPTPGLRQALAGDRPGWAEAI